MSNEGHGSHTHLASQMINFIRLHQKVSRAYYVGVDNVMRMQLEEESAGRYIPVFKVLPSPYRTLEAGDETED